MFSIHLPRLTNVYNMRLVSKNTMTFPTLLVSTECSMTAILYTYDIREPEESQILGLGFRGAIGKIK